MILNAPEETAHEQRIRTPSDTIREAKKYPLSAESVVQWYMKIFTEDSIFLQNGSQ